MDNSKKRIMIFSFILGIALLVVLIVIAYELSKINTTIDLKYFGGGSNGTYDSGGFVSITNALENIGDILNKILKCLQ